MKKLILLYLILLSTINYSQEVALDLVASNFNGITEITNAGDDRLFITEQSGLIRILKPDGSKSTFLDIRNRIGTGSERGLLGLAFAPDYATTGRFYVNYTDRSSRPQHTVIARYTVSSNPDRANNNETIILRIEQPFSNHNGGKILFGLDGFLYIGMGDGGSGGDPRNLALNTNELLGKLLRIDVSGSTYTNPPGNPFINGGGRPEIYAVGLRNPWKISFDDVTENLWIADVGQNAFEEVNVVDSKRPGLNYGWRCFEGRSRFNNDRTCPRESETVRPVEVQSHRDDGVCSITGGFVYRGQAYQNFVGKYFYGDICSREIGILTNNNGTWQATYQRPSNAVGYRTFGEDVNRELYVASGSNIYRITDPTVLSTPDIYKRDEITFFPNPADDSVTVDFGKNRTEIDRVSIFNIQGQKILEVPSNNQQNISISTKSLAGGMYLLEFSSNQGFKSVEKLVIK